MKICFVSFEYPPEIIGGMGTYAEHLVRGLKEKGVDTYVITRGDKTCRDNKTYRIFVPDILYWRRFFFINHATRFFHNLSRLCRFDLIHLNGTYPIVRGLKLPTVSTLHAIPNIKQAAIGLKLVKSYKSVRDIMYLTLKNPVGSIFDFTTVQASDRIICPSPSLAREIMLYCFADKQKIRIIQNGIDLKEFDETECFDTTLLDHYNIQKENFLLYVGRLSFLKGIQYLIEAFKIVQNQHPNLKLVIVGSGDFEQQLRKTARNIKGILFIGYVESMRIKKLLYDASLAVILPSSAYEVSPMTILETMASRKPVIASNVEGNSFMVKHGKNGFLSKPRDSVNLAEFINVLLEDKALRRRMGKLGRKLVENEFTMEKMVNKTLKTYESLLH
jgi:glycosyltransferase involved in cell wall biosynthesis